MWLGAKIVSDGTNNYWSFGQTTGNTQYYFGTDHLGSLRDVTDLNGNLVTEYDYDLWGNRTRIQGTQDFNLGFTGHWVIEDLVLAPFRAYNPYLGGWVSRDPIGEYGGINLYGYIGNDPIYRRDYLGLSPTGVLYGGAIGGFIGGLGALVLGGAGGTIALPGGGRTIAGADLGEGAGAALGAGIGAWLGNILTGGPTQPQGPTACHANNPPPVPDNPADPPGEGWEWRGNGAPGSDQGSWYNPGTGESLHPDLNHPDPVGPHWDWIDSEGNQWRIPPGGGTPQPK